MTGEPSPPTSPASYPGRAGVRQQPWRPIPILGARTVQQLPSNLRALDLVLDDDALARLDAASAIPLGFPHDTLRSPSHLRSVTGGHADLLDRHRCPFLASPMEPS